MQKLRTPNQEETGVLLAMLATIFGGWVRLFIPAIAGFPVNDGGLFYVMVRAVQENNLHLPTYVHYNGLNVPFAYPPLTFFIGAILSNLLHLSVIKILQWLPAIVLVGTIPAFYSLAKAVLASSFRAGVATLIFAFLPRAMTWQIMGGGLTRSFGQLFLLLALVCIYQLFTKRDKKYLILSILFSTLVVLTHPEATVQTIGFAFLFWIFKGRNKAGILNALLVGLSTIVLTAVWWLPLLLHLGLGPILAAGQTGLHTAYAIFYPLLLTFTDEPLMTITAVLSVIGFAVQTAKKDFLIPLWFLLPFFVEPRSAPTVAMIPLALMAGIALDEVILAALATFESQARNLVFENRFQSHTVQFFMTFIGLYLLGSTFYFGTQIAATTLSQANRTAFGWIKSNTEAGSQFLVLTGDTELFCDSAQEWFPALTERVSLTTVQGTEWLPGRYAVAASTQLTVQNCLSGNDALGCVEQTARQENLQYDYIYVVRQSSIKNFCRAVATSPRGEAIISALNNNSRYNRVYQTDEVSVFSLQH